MSNVIIDSDSLFSKPCHWVLIASLSSVDIASKKSWLSADELERCDRYRRDEDQQRFILAHALKRFCLSRYLQVPASSLQFSSGAKGKPHCTHKNAPAFNLSHSGEFVILGLSAIAHIGVDVENIGRDVSSDIYPRVLTAQQQQKLVDSPEPHYEFMCYWTQKEAISKALGLGMSIDFATVECSGLEGEFEEHHSNQRLLVSTQQWDHSHIVSVASTVSTPLQMLALRSWQEELLIDNQGAQAVTRT